MSQHAMAAVTKAEHQPSPSRFVVSEIEAAQLLNLAPRTLQAMRLEGSGPRFVQLTERRIGYSVGELHAWVERRSVGSTSAATVAELDR